MAFNGRFVLNVIEFARKQGARPEELLANSSTSMLELREETCFMENIEFNAVLVKAIEVTGDDFFGLHAGEHLNLSAAGVIGQMTQSSETVRQALELACRYANIECSSLPIELIEEKDHYKLVLTPNELWKKQSEEAVQHCIEGLIAFKIRQFQSLTHEFHTPIAVHVPWNEAKDVVEYRRVYKCPIRFGQNEAAILLSKAHVEESITNADYNLLRILVAYAEEKSAKINQQLGFAAQVKASILNLIKPSFPTISQVASTLNMSRRTLQRRLKEEGYVYKDLIDELRKESARSYLKREDLTIGEVATLLDYADTSTFSRSFKRWFGITPSEFRVIQ